MWLYFATATNRVVFGWESPAQKLSEGRVSRSEEYARMLRYNRTELVLLSNFKKKLSGLHPIETCQIRIEFMDFDNQNGNYAFLWESAAEEDSEQPKSNGLGAKIPSLVGNSEIRRLETQFAVTKILVNSPSLENAIPDLLKEICKGMDWEIGELWLPDQNTKKLRFAGCSSLCSIGENAIREHSQNMHIAIRHGTPGIVWQTKGPLWIEDVRHDAHFMRQPMAKSLGLGGSLAFPILTHGEVAGVMVFFVREARAVDKWITDIMTDIGQQIGLFMDRKKKEQTIALYVEQLERTNQELVQFSHVASHDLKQPLRTMITFLQLIGVRHQKELSGECRKLFSHVVDSSRRMAALVDELLKYAELGGPGRPHAIINCNKVVKRILTDLRKDIQEAEVRISCGKLPRLKANERQFSQVIQNLLSNAIKYQNGNAPEISISAEERKTEWVFTVQDNGIGVAAENLKAIFLPFKRLHGHETYSGTGIGLAICEKIVAQHGGRIWVESALGVGSQFHFAIPKA